MVIAIKSQTQIKIITVLTSAYIFLNCLPNTIAGRYATLGLLLLAVGYGIYRRLFVASAYMPMLMSLLLFSGAVLLSAVSSDEPIESLNSLRKDYLPAIMLLLISLKLKTNEKQTNYWISLIMAATLSGFVLKTILAFWDGAINNPFVFSPYDNSELALTNGLPRFVSYYAHEATLYLTMALSFILYINCKRAIKAIVFAASIISYAIIMYSGIRTSFISAIVGVFIAFLFYKNFFLTKIAICIIIAASLTAFINSHNGMGFKRYSEIFSSKVYSKEDGMSGRYFIWEGVYEIYENKPILGFGPGWQKLPTVANNLGLIEKWKLQNTKYDQHKAEYFSGVVGQINPHNLVLQMLFEIGSLGLVAYLLLYCAFIYSAFYRVCIGQQWIGTWLIKSLVVFVPVFMIENITNSFFLNNTLIALFCIIAISTRRLDVDKGCDSE